jgi:PPOX class probable F420-dependent enzyme
LERLRDEHNVWLATAYPDGRPHLTPIWFAWHADRMWLCTNASAVKARNVSREPRVMISLESGGSPVVGEGRARVRQRPYPADVVDAFIAKFEWDISAPDNDGPYDALIEIEITRWLMGGE